MKVNIWFIAPALLVLAVAAFAGCTGTQASMQSSGTSIPWEHATGGGTISGNNTAPPGGMPPGGFGPNGTPSDGMMPRGNSRELSGSRGPGDPPPGGRMGTGNATSFPGSRGGPAGAPPDGVMGLGGNFTPPAGGMGGPGSSGTLPGGAPGNSSSGSSSYTFSGTYTLDGGTATESDGLYTSETTDVSGVYVTSGGNLTLVRPTIITNGDTSSNDASSFYGLNGAVLANDGSTVAITGGVISTTGSGANGAIPTGTGTTITLTDVKISASGGGGHGVMATNGGTLVLTGVDLETSGANGAPLATDRGSGTVTATRGTVLSSGRDSPGIYSTGVITVTDGSITATGSEAAVIEGFNSIVLANTTLSGGVEKTGGTMIYQSMSGDADTGTGTFTMIGGSYTSSAGPAFFVTNTNAVIGLKGVKVTSNSDTLIKAAGTDRWGTSGKNGGTVTFTADGVALTGSLVTDSISSIDATLNGGSSLTGAINSAALALDSSSTWIVTGDSALTTLSDTGGISGTTIANILGNGHTVTYDTSLDGNRALGGQTYTLANGGTLRPS